MTDRLHEIRRAVQNISTTAPSTNDSDLMWFKPDRGSPNYYRLVRTDFDGGEEGYDVWMETDASFDTAGHLQVRCEVICFELGVRVQRDQETIFGTGFDGYDQPREQAFLNNVHHYEQQAQDAIDEFAETAKLWAEHELMNPNLPQAA